MKILIKEVKYLGPCTFKVRRDMPFISTIAGHGKINYIIVTIAAGMAVYHYRKPTFIERMLGVRKK